MSNNGMAYLDSLTFFCMNPLNLLSHPKQRSLLGASLTLFCLLLTSSCVTTGAKATLPSSVKKIAVVSNVSEAAGRAIQPIQDKGYIATNARDLGVNYRSGDDVRSVGRRLGADAVLVIDVGTPTRQSSSSGSYYRGQGSARLIATDNGASLWSSSTGATDFSQLLSLSLVTGSGSSRDGAQANTGQLLASRLPTRSFGVAAP